MHFISAEETKLGYYRSGHGERVLFAFHGFGQSSKAFNNLSLAYPPELFTIYSFDLFYHGESKHPYSEEVRKFIWKHMIDKLMTRDGIKEVDIICYSIGSIFAICTFMIFPERVRTMSFIAPDGLKTSSIYALATSTFGKPIFKHLMKKPYALVKSLDVLFSMGVFPKFSHRFLTLMLKDRSKRMNIYTSWVNFKPLYYDFEEFKDMCFKHTPSITFFLGKNDFVIKTSRVKPIAKELPNVTVVELKSNHHKMIFETVKYLLKDKK